MAGPVVMVFLAADFLVAAFLAAGFLAEAALVPVPRLRPRPAAAFFSLPGQSMLGQSFHGPRAVVTMTMGAPQSGHSSPVASSLPRWGSG